MLLAVKGPEGRWDLQAKQLESCILPGNHRADFKHSPSLAQGTFFFSFYLGPWQLCSWLCVTFSCQEGLALTALSCLETFFWIPQDLSLIWGFSVSSSRSTS